jgi:hypothetical protein
MFTCPLYTGTHTRLLQVPTGVGLKIIALNSDSDRDWLCKRVRLYYTVLERE